MGKGTTIPLLCNVEVYLPRVLPLGLLATGYALRIKANHLDHRKGIEVA